MQKAAKEYDFKTSGWTDGSGHMVYLFEYESAEDHAKAWSDDEFYEICEILSSH